MKNTYTNSLLVLGATLLLSMPVSAQTTAYTGPTTFTPRQKLDRAVQRLQALGDERYSEAKLALDHDITQMLRRNPALVATVPTRVRAVTTGDETANTLIHALEAVGTPRAQRALATIQSDPTNLHANRLRAVMGLAAVEDPTPASIASLWSSALQRSDPDSVDLSNTALLALGAAGSRLSSNSPLYRTLTRGLLSGLGQSSDLALRAVTLKGIGNLHNPGFGRIVVDYLFDDRAPVRASAAHALGALQAVDQRDLMASQLANEPRGAVRSAIVSALRKLPASEFTLETIDDLVVGERHPHARATMVRYLVDHFHGFAPARGTLLELAATDSSQQVRILASYALRH